MLNKVRGLTHSKWMKTTAKREMQYYFSVRSLGGKSKTVNILRILAWFVTIRFVANKNLICKKQTLFFCHKSFCGIAIYDLFFQHAPIDVEATFCLWVNVVVGCDHTSVGYGEELEIIVKKSNYLSTCKGNLQDLCMQTLFLYMSQLPLNEAAWIVLN